MYPTRDITEFYRKNSEAMIALIISKGIQQKELAWEIYHKWVIQTIKYDTLSKYREGTGASYETYITTTLYNCMGQHRKKQVQTIGLQFVPIAEKDNTRYRELLNDLNLFKATLNDEENELLNLLFQSYSPHEIAAMQNITTQWVHIRRKRIYHKWVRFSNK